METAVKRLYEALFLADSTLAASQWNELMGAIEKVLERADADVKSIKKWDDRRMAYEINGAARGVYILSYFECDPLKISGIERDVNLSEMIMRVLILRADEFTEEDINKATPLEAAVQKESPQPEAEESIPDEEIPLDDIEAEDDDFDPDAQDESEPV